MKSLRVRILRRAQIDLDEIAHYHRREAPAAADRIVDQLLDAMEGLAATPPSRALVRDERLRALGFRVLVVGLYLVFYKASGSEVRVYRVLHGKREYRGLL